MTAALKEMCGLEERDRVGTHKEVSLKRFQKDEEDVTKMVSTFTSGLMSNPFGLEEADSEGKTALPFTNLATEMGGASTFGELASKYYSIVTAPLHNKGYQQVDLVFDQYRQESIKGAERLNREVQLQLWK